MNIVEYLDIDHEYPLFSVYILASCFSYFINTGQSGDFIVMTHLKKKLSEH